MPGTGTANTLGRQGFALSAFCMPSLSRVALLGFDSLAGHARGLAPMHDPLGGDAVMANTITQVDLVPTLSREDAISRVIGAVRVQGTGGEVATIAECAPAMHIDDVETIVSLQRKVGTALDKSPVNGARIIGAVYAFKVLDNNDAQQAWEFAQVITKFSDLENFFVTVNKGTDALNDELDALFDLKEGKRNLSEITYRQPANVKKRFAKELDKLGLTPEQYFETVQ